MNPVIRDSLLWGIVGGLSFVVLTLGYELAMNPGIDLVVIVVGSVIVFVASAATVYLLGRRLPERGDGPGEEQ